VTSMKCESRDAFLKKYSNEGKINECDDRPSSRRITRSAHSRTINMRGEASAAYPCARERLLH
jgi:hypothetical protein